MLDLKKIRMNPEAVKEALLKRVDDLDFTELLTLDTDFRDLDTKVDEMKNRRNIVSGEIPVLKKNGSNVKHLLDEMKSLSLNIKDSEKQLKKIENLIYDILIELPNIPLDDVVAGDKENNQVIKKWGEKPIFEYKFRGHMELVESLGLIDYKRGVKMGGNGFWLYKGIGARLEWALINYCIDSHLMDDYEFILPPHILNNECGYVAGQFPKFADDVYRLNDGDKESTQFLLPTSETALVNYYRDETLKDSDLPKKLFAYSPCYRQEAGSYRSEERGMIRGHQFNKVEMFHFTKPEDSNAGLQELLDKAEKLVQGLGLHYIVSKLAAKDCSASMAKTLDLEVWIPSMNIYKEISSVSNGTDYQARRGNIRFKREGSKKSEFVNTLNGSGLATSRLLPAIIEQFQQEDGSVIVPEVLQKWVGCKILRPTN
ncbi:MAG: serine--tRNA ligase [Spirochaetaceae bacterium]